MTNPIGTTPLALCFLSFIAGCTSDVTGTPTPGGGTLYAVGISAIGAFENGTLVHHIPVDSYPGTRLHAPSFASDAGSVWGVVDGSLSHWDLAGEALVASVPLPEEPAYDLTLVTADAVWLIGGNGTLWITKVTKTPLAVSSTIKVEAKWFAGAHVGNFGVDVLVSNGTEIVRVDPESATIARRLELSAFAGTAEMVVVGDEYWVGLGGSSPDAGFVRVSIRDLSILERTAEPAPWPQFRGAYGFHRTAADERAIYAANTSYADGGTKGCIVRVPLDDPSLSHNLYCVDPNDDTADLQDLFLGPHDLWVLDDLYGSFVRLDATTGQELDRVEGFAADGFFP